MSSTVNVRRISTTRGAVIYELYGTRGSKKFKTHLAEGSTRVAAMRTDAGSVDEYVERAEALTAKHGRKIEARSIIQSFPAGQMDRNDPARVQYVNDLGYELAKRLHPNSDVLVITHVDGAGGHPHNHIKVINHDNVTGKALRGKHLHWQVVPVNDALMTEHRLGTVERSSRKQHAGYWEEVRDAKKLSEFDLKLGDDIKESLADSRSIDLPSYSKVLAEKGIDLEEKTYAIRARADGTQPAHESVGWTYKAVDETGPKHRKRRRKASVLSRDFTLHGAQELFDINKERKAKNVISKGADRAARARASGAAARLHIDLGDVELVEFDRLSAGSGVNESRRTGDDAERNHAGRDELVDLSGTRSELKTVEERSEKQQGDRQDARGYERNAHEVASSAPSGRQQGKPRGPQFVFDDDRTAGANERRDRGD